MLLLALLSCARHAPAPPPTAEGCQAGDLAMCRALAAAAPDDPAAALLDRWACDEGHAPSCVAAASGAPPREAAADLARACETGLDSACTTGAALPDDRDARGEIGRMAQRACVADAEAPACARLRDLGWSGPEVRDVRVVGGLPEGPRVVLPGGTVIALDDDAVVVAGAKGVTRLPVSAQAGHLPLANIRALTSTADGRLLAVAADPPVVWSMLDGGVERLDVWPPLDGPVALAPDGRAVAGLTSAGVATWALPEARFLGFVRPVGEPRVLALADAGRRILQADRQGFSLADTVQAPRALPLQEHGVAALGEEGRWASLHDGVLVLQPGDRRAPAPEDRLALSPDGRLVALAGRAHVRLLTTDAAEAGTVQLPPLGDGALVFSADGGRLAAPLAGGGVAVITLRSARGDAKADAATVDGLRGPPPVPSPGEPVLRDDGKVDGLVTIAGVPAPRVDVVVTPCTAGPAPLKAFTGPDGRFAMTRVPRGCWTFAAKAKGAMPGEVKAVVAPQATPVKLDLAPTTRAEGVVKGADGRPAADVTVRARHPSGVTATATTDKRGRFTLEPVPAGGFQLSATRAGEGVVVDVADVSIPLAVALRPALAVRATRDPNAPGAARVVAKAGGRQVEGVLPADGAWITTGFAAGETVELAVVEGAQRGKPVRVTLPAAGEVALEGPAYGRLRVVLQRRGPRDVIEVVGADCRRTADGCDTGWIPAGRYEVLAHAADHRAGVSTVEVLAGDPTVAPAPLDGRLGSVAGRVVDAGTGRPLAGVRVVARCGVLDAESAAITGPDGRFRLDRVLPAELTLRVSPPPGWKAVEPRLVVTAEGLADLGDVKLGR